MTDVIPTGYTFVGTLPAGVGSFNSTNNTYTWPIGNFNSGTSNQSVQVIVSVNPTGNYQNCASISGNQVDPNSSNNSSCITPIPNPISNLAIVKTVSPNNASVGDVVTFSLTVTNNGPSGANNVVVFDTLPSGFNYTSSLPAGWFNNNTHQWNIGSLANGATTSLSITATVLPNGTVNNYTNFSTVNSTVSDPNTSNNVDTARVNVTQFSNLAISKSYSPAYPSVGSQIVFTITATNLGLSNATGVIVNDPLPSGYTLDSIVLSSGSYTSPNWNIGNLSASTGLNTASMLVYAQVLPAGNYTNTAIISGNEPDPNSSNNTVSITPLLINVPPIANNDTTITIEDSWVSINVVNPVPVSSSTDTDIDGTVNPASVDLNPSVPGIQPNFTDAFGNTWLAVSTGVVTFTPASNFNGTATANYTVLDDDGAISNQALIVVYVAPINDAPILDNEYLITYQGDPISGDLTDAGDFDVDGNLIVLSYSGPTNFGSIVISSNGDFTYTPNTGFIGLDTFVVQICDDGTPLPSLCSNDTIFISVLPTINPIALNDTTNTLEDTQVTLNITSNDIDPDGTIVSSTVDLDTLTPGIQDSVTNIYGTWIVDNLGNVTFYPALNYYGAASVDYVVNDDDGATSNSATIYVLVAPVNDTPVVDNDYLFTSINLPGSGDAIDAGDSDIDGNLTVGAIIQNSQNGGTFVISPNGDFTYTPLAGYTGNDTIVVEICDDGYPLPSICVNDTIFIVIIPSNPPVANNDTTSVFEDTPGGVTFNVTNNDTDDGTIVSSTVDLDTITPGIQNTITNQYGTWTSDSSGAVTFVPASNYCGLAYAFYYISDNNTLVSNNPAQITVNVLCVNDGPITNDVTVATSVNTPIAINVAAATSDLENNPLTFTYNPPIGTNYTINGNGEITVNPPVNFVGTILIPFTVCDLSPYNVTILCDSGLITVNVLDTTGINNAPIANTDLVTTTMNSPVIINPLGNDYDPNGDSLVITILNGPTVVGSSVSLNSSTGLVTFTPATGFTGTDSVHYQICDNGTPQLCDDAYIIIVVSPGFDNSNTAPIATNDYVTIFEDSSITYAVLTNDIDPNGNNIGLPIIVNGPNFGSASVSATGEITYIPNANYNGQDTIEYQICDD
ncbi:MAG: Ig-like domain-containing protein, partial [Bacteroidota bacterium]